MAKKIFLRPGGAGAPTGYAYVAATGFMYISNIQKYFHNGITQHK